MFRIQYTSNIQSPPKFRETELLAGSYVDQDQAVDALRRLAGEWVIDCGAAVRNFDGPYPDGPAHGFTVRADKKGYIVDASYVVVDTSVLVNATS